ncbi:MAG: histidine phosphatase family protein [bacterium]|nr:histidine phosphatase family protein [bacterium]
MELYLIRHGQSLNNSLEGTGDRVADPPLTELGQEQAERIGEYLKAIADKTDEDTRRAGYGIQRLFCSAMLRTLQTTQPIARAMGLRPEIWLDVHEEGGIWLDKGDGRGPAGHSGLMRSEIEAQFPGFIMPDGMGENGWWNRPKETYEEMIERAKCVAEAIVGWEKGERVAIVSHGAFINGLVQVLLHGDALGQVYFSNHNTAINRLDFLDNGLLRVRYLNRVEHLPPERIS